MFKIAITTEYNKAYDMQRELSFFCESFSLPAATVPHEDHQTKLAVFLYESKSLCFELRLPELSLTSRPYLRHERSVPCDKDFLATSQKAPFRLRTWSYGREKNEEQYLCGKINMGDVQIFKTLKMCPCSKCKKTVLTNAMEWQWRGGGGGDN